MRRVEQPGVEAHEPSVRDLGVTLPRGVRAHEITEEHLENFFKKSLAYAESMDVKGLSPGAIKRRKAKITEAVRLHNEAELNYGAVISLPEIFESVAAIARNPFLSKPQVEYIRYAAKSASGSRISVLENLLKTNHDLPIDLREKHEFSEAETLILALYLGESKSPEAGE
jgi:hypothetical protein